MAQQTPNYGLEMPEATDDFKDFRESYNGNMVIIDNKMGGGGGSGGHTIYDEAGNALPQESGMQFTGAVTVSDDSGNRRTVVNIESGGGTYNLNTIYSTEEKKVGYWTDGKPLYQKTINFGALPNNDTKDVSHGISNVEKIWVSGGFAYQPNGDFSNQLSLCVPSNLSAGWYFGASSSVIRCQTSTDRTNYSAFVILQYTKTTDTPELNPQVGNVIYLPTIYAEEEREIGCWTDGKPLYQRTYDLGSEIAISNTSWQSLGISTSGFETMPKCSGIASDGSFQSELLAWNNNGTLYVQTPRNSTGYVQYITLQYTKTTDTPGSGTWTPNGAAAVHYSTNEQVIGTWKDGKPIYQRTWDFSGSPVMLSYANWVDSGISASENIKSIISAELKGGIVTNMAVEVAAGADGYPVAFQKVENTGNTRSVSYCTLRYTKTTD